MKLSLPVGRYGDGPALGRLGRQLVAREDGLPGVTHAALATSLPMELGPDLPFIIEGRWKGNTGPANADGEREGEGQAQYRAVTPGFFQTLAIPVVAGRDLHDADSAGRELVVVINQSLAKRYFPQKNPLGQRIPVDMTEAHHLYDPPPRTQVGILCG